MKKVTKYIKNKFVSKLIIRKAFVLGCVLFLTGMCIFYYPARVFAEQSGSSPDSGVNSRLLTIYNALTALNYGSTTAGTWGDWGNMWNRVYSAAQGQFNDAKAKGMKSGSGTGGLSAFTQVLGGVDDYNNGGGTPSNSYTSGTWTTCNAGNSYCGTGRSVAEKQDPNTGLVWSPRLSGLTNWYKANNCSNSDGNPCVKRMSAQTGCEGYDDLNWRLPSQKELMQSYIDGSNSNLSNPSNNYWSSNTSSTGTTYAWYIDLNNGYAANYNTANGKSWGLSVYARCVR